MSRSLFAVACLPFLAQLFSPSLALAQEASANPEEAAAVLHPVDLRVMSFNIWYGGVQVSQPQLIEILRASDADIIGLQEPDGQTAAIAAAAGYPYVDLRRHIISRYPLFDPKLGERTDQGQAPYPLAGLDADAPQVWVMLAPGQVIGFGNLHLSSDPYGPHMLRDGASLDEVLQAETETRVAEVTSYFAALEPLAKEGVPLIVTGDFNTPSHLDWTEAAKGSRPGQSLAVEWPVTKAVESAGFSDAFRSLYPDPVQRPGLTYSPGFPWPLQVEGESMDRIDYISPPMPAHGPPRSGASQITPRFPAALRLGPRTIGRLWLT